MTNDRHDETEDITPPAEPEDSAFDAAIVEAAAEEEAADTEKQATETEKEAADTEKEAADTEKQAAETEKQAAETEKEAADTEGAEPTVDVRSTLPVDDVEAEQPLPEPRPAAPADTEAIVPPTEAVEAQSDRPRGPLAALRDRDPLVPILAAVTALLLVLTVLLGLMVFAPKVAPVKLGATRLAVEGQDKAEITQTAERFAKNYLTIDYRTIDRDFERLGADATDNFKDELERVLKESREPFKDAKATSKGKVADSLIISHEGGTATVRVAVDRTIDDAETKDPQTGSQLLDVSLAKTGDGWKVDGARPLTEGQQ